MGRPGKLGLLFGADGVFGTDNLEKIPEDRLRESFSALGVRLTVWFEKVPYGKNRTKNVPARGELVLGKDGQVRVPDGVDTVSIKKPRKAKIPTKKRAAQREPVGTLPIVGRGDWI